MERKIFCFWTGSNKITENRARCLENMRSVLGVPVELVTMDNLKDYIVDPIPDAYQCLSETHKADFLRFYFMHHHGGGYADIKEYTKPWNQYFDRFDSNSELEIIGTREKNRDCIFEFELQIRYHELLSFGWFIMRDHTKLSELMYQRALSTLNQFESKLHENPSSCPRDKFGMELPDGTISKYPLRWGKIGGSVFHPSIAKRLDMLSDDEKLKVINYDLPSWNFKENYL